MTILNFLYHHCSHIEISNATIKGIMVLLNIFLIGSLGYGIYEFFKYKMARCWFWETLFDNDRPIVLYIQVMTLVLDALCIIFYLGKLIGSWL